MVSSRAFHRRGWRRVFTQRRTQALAKLMVCGPTSRWLIRHFFDSCTNSIGSSTVRMWPYSVSLRWLTMPASVVDLPGTGGAGDQHQTTRLGQILEHLGRVELLERQDLGGMVRNTAPATVLVEGVDRKRARPWISKEKSHLQRFFVVLALGMSFMMSYTMSWTCLWSRGVDVDAADIAVHADHGGRPADRCRSDALF